jgi:ferredoxin--NADP+ reductase
LGIGLSTQEDASPRDCVYLLADPADRFEVLPPTVVPVNPSAAWSIIGATHFPELGPGTGYDHPLSEEDAEVLRGRHYNATITDFVASPGDHWILRVQPDSGRVGYLPGDFASIGVGLWEQRADDHTDVGSDESLQRMVHRSFTISSRVFDHHGYLADPASAEELEFYMVLVPSTKKRMSSLTPRLALFKEGDRIYVGPGVCARYSLDPVTDPFAPVFFLAMATGEAPHISMIVELLRRGHQGPTTSVVAVRRDHDLMYREKLRALEERYPNFGNVALTNRTAKPSQNQMQDYITSGALDGLSGGRFSPDGAHVFACGNPAMVGTPTWAGDAPQFPDLTGVSELLYGRGFDLNRLGSIGNVHVEVFW